MLFLAFSARHGGRHGAEQEPTSRFVRSIPFVPHSAEINRYNGKVSSASFAASGLNLFPSQLIEVCDRAFRLVDRAAFDGQHDIPFGLAADADDPGPINDAVAAGAADGRAGHFAAFGRGLRLGDVLGVEVNEPSDHFGRATGKGLVPQR